MIESQNASPSGHIWNLVVTGTDGPRPWSALSTRCEVVSARAHPARVLGRGDRSGTTEARGRVGRSAESAERSTGYSNPRSSKLMTIPIDLSMKSTREAVPFRSAARWTPVRERLGTPQAGALLIITSKTYHKLRPAMSVIQCSLRCGGSAEMRIPKKRNLLRAADLSHLNR